MKKVKVILNEISNKIICPPKIDIVEDINNKMTLEYGKESSFSIQDDTKFLIYNWSKGNESLSGQVFLTDKEEITIKVNNCMDKNMINFVVI